MAKQMGFSSFGTQRLAKKRKYNPVTDAVVHGQERAALGIGGKGTEVSGGNKIPLTKPRVLGVVLPRNQEEIELDVEANKDEEPVCTDTGLPPPSEQEDEGEDEGPAYIDTSWPPPNEDAEAAQQKINAILAKSTVLPIPPDPKAKVLPQVSETSKKVGHFVAAQQDGTRPSNHNVLDRLNGHAVISSYQPKTRSCKNELWYIDYYDPSFNENPWEKLEKISRLEARGTWVEREGRRHENCRQAIASCT